MSYILEALKKLEQKRAPEDTPRLFIFSLGAHRAERRKRLFWPYVLAAALLVNAVVMTWWIGNRQVGDGAAAAKKAAPGQEAAPVGDIASGEERHSRPESAVPAASAPHERPLRASIYKLPRKIEMPPETQAKQVAPPSLAPAPAAPAPPAARVADIERSKADAQPAGEKSKRGGGNALRTSELPPDIRAALPEFRISGHAYSPDPQTRVARINEKILQEGQELAPGLKLEEIVPEGVIFSYQGYRFRVDANITNR